MAVRVSEVQAPAAQFPLPPFLHSDSFHRQPCFPVRQFTGWDGEGNVQLAVTVMRRLNRTRRPLLKEQKHLLSARMHCAAAFAELADHTKPKDFLVEANRADEIAHVQRGFQNSTGNRGHKPPSEHLPPS